MNSIKIVYSAEDPAGTNVAERLRETHGFGERETVEKNARKFIAWQREEGGKKIELIQVEERLARECEYLAELPEVFSADLMIFSSRHRAENPVACFTAHAPGNFTQKNEFGGNPGELAVTSARASACLLRHLKKKEKENGLGGFGVFREATHHGPTSLPWPCLFAELGSSEEHWGNEKAAGKLAEAIIFAAENYEEEEGAISVGFGGTHYCSKFSAMEFGGAKCFSHVASKYVLDATEGGAVKQAIEKTVEKVEGVFLDWKGTTLPQREKLKKIFAELGVEWERV